jgi:hypothetical protein
MENEAFMFQSNRATSLVRLPKSSAQANENIPIHSLDKIAIIIFSMFCPEVSSAAISLITKRKLPNGAHSPMWSTFTRQTRREPWNKGKLVGQKAPLKLKDIWAIRGAPRTR